MSFEIGDRVKREIPGNMTGHSGGFQTGTIVRYVVEWDVASVDGPVTQSSEVSPEEITKL